MYCKECGQFNQDGSKFCAFCGAVFEAENNSAIKSISKIKLNRNKIFALAAICIAAVVLIVIIASTSQSPGQSVVKQYIDATKNQNAKQIINLSYPEFIIDYYEDIHDRDKNDLIYATQDFFDYANEALIDEVGVTLEEFYHSIDYEILSERECSKSELNDLNNHFYEYYDADPNCVSELIKVKVRITIDWEPEDYKRSETAEYYVMKVGGKWYLESYRYGYNRSDPLTEMLVKFAEYFN